ncbi:MAG: DNA polymerase III subunit delta [Candidatus Hydrogenedens sp.]
MDIKQFKKVLAKEGLHTNCLLFCPAVSGSKESFEPVLAEEVIEELTKSFIPEGTESVGLHTFYGDETRLEEIVMECSTLPFFSSRKVVIVRKFELLDRSEKSDVKSIRPMLNYLQNPLDTTLLLCVTETVDSRKPLYKAFASINGVVECPALNNNELNEWIKQYLYSKKKKISPDGLEEFVSRCGTKLSDIRNALTLLLGFVGDKDSITIKDVLNSCADVAEESIWSLTDAIALGNMKMSWLILNDLINQGKEPPEIVSVIHWLLENAYKTTELSEEKPRSNFVMSKVTPLAQRFGIKKLVTAMNLCNETTYAMRQTGTDERTALELLVLKLSYIPPKQKIN